MAGWHHQLDGHEFERTLGDGEGQGSLVYCSPWDRKESDTTEQLNQNDVVSSRTRDPTRVPCIGRWILNLWTTREVP